MIPASDTAQEMPRESRNENFKGCLESLFPENTNTLANWVWNKLPTYGTPTLRNGVSSDIKPSQIFPINFLKKLLWKKTELNDVFGQLKLTKNT